uniref:F0F1 ATP synthase subunit A n=1 Tax=Polaribacter sp. TaxID=1920175 RepID=UPI003F6B2F44
MKIAQKTIKFLTIAAIVLFTAVSFASGTDKKHDNQNDGGRVNTKTEVEEYILHHIKDSHDFSLWSYTNDDNERVHIGAPLPVILWTSEGLVTFMSSEFHHNDDGHVIVEKKGLKFAKIHSKIYELDKGAATVSFDKDHHATNAHKVLDFSITKSVVGILLIGFLLLFWFSRLAKQYKTKKVPTGFARVLEPLVLYVRDEIAKPNIGEKHYRRFTGYLLTVFFFIWLLNLAGLTPFGFNVTGQLAVTACLAIFTLIIY